MRVYLFVIFFCSIQPTDESSSSSSIGLVVVAASARRRSTDRQLRPPKRRRPLARHDLDERPHAARPPVDAHQRLQREANAQQRTFRHDGQLGLVEVTNLIEKISAEI